MADDYSFNTSTTGVVTPNLRASGGTIEEAGDKDMFAVSLTAGTTYTFNLTRLGVTGLGDPLLELYSPGLTLVTSDDDSGINLQSRIVYTAATSGTYYLGAMGVGTSTGVYNITAASAAVAQSISIGTPKTQVSEGDSVVFYISAPASLAGTSYQYTLQGGISVTDIAPGNLNGAFTLGVDGRARVTVNIANDGLNEGTETIAIGTDNGATQSVTILDTSRPTVAVSATARNLLGVYGAFYGSAPTTSATLTNEINVYNAGGASAYAADVASRFAATPNQSLAGTVLANLNVSSQTVGGLTPAESYTLLRDALSIYFTAFPSSKGQVVLNLVNLLTGLERDFTYGAAAIGFNTTMGTRFTASGLAAAPDADLMGLVPASLEI